MSKKTGKYASASKRMLYFAYGSNMHLTQMAERCPTSIFKGIGTLAGYRWQINSRGVANIVESRDQQVEGVVFEIDQSNKRQLDRNEGVSRGFYSDEHLPILCTPSANGGYKTGYVAKKLKSARPNDTDLEPFDTQSGPTEEPAHVNALVYISKNYKEDGNIRDEYIVRMENALTDGQKLGLSRWFLDQVRDCIHRRPRSLPREGQSSLDGQHAAERQRTSESDQLDEALTVQPLSCARPAISSYSINDSSYQQPHYIYREPLPTSRLSISNANTSTIRTNRNSTYDRASSEPPCIRDVVVYEVRWVYDNEIRRWR